jgi:uncharacterized DUF497 family protein
MRRLATFEWDNYRARANLRRNAVDFADAVAVLEDEEALTMRDELTAVDEQRCLSLGRDARGRVLVVTHAHRRCRVRLLVARRATVAERRQYLERGR